MTSSPPCSTPSSSPGPSLASWSISWETSSAYRPWHHQTATCPRFFPSLGICPRLHCPQTLDQCQGNGRCPASCCLDAIANARQLLANGSTLNFSSQIRNHLNDPSRQGVDLQMCPAVETFGSVTLWMRPRLQLSDHFLYVRCLVRSSKVICLCGARIVCGFSSKIP